MVGHYDLQGVVKEQALRAVNGVVGINNGTDLDESDPWRVGTINGQ